jgi:hypothetical protein
MADCLKSNLSVQEPVYCQDASGNILPDTAMYSWMAVRAAGPNVLQDTTLCGNTRLDAPQAPNQAFYQVYLVNNAEQGGASMVTSILALDTWYPFGFANYNTRTWTIKYEGSETNQAFGIFDFGRPPAKQPGAVGIYNANSREITARMTLTCSITTDGPTDAGGFLEVGLWQTEVAGTALPSTATVQTLELNVDEQVTIPITCDFITIMKPNETIQPVVRFVSAGSGSLSNVSIVDVNLVGEFIDFYNNDGGDNKLPGGEEGPPGPPPT